MSPPDPDAMAFAAATRPATPHSSNPAALFARAREQSAMAGMSRAALARARARADGRDEDGPGAAGLYAFPYARTGEPQRVPTPPVRHRVPIFALPSLPGVDADMDPARRRPQQPPHPHPHASTHHRRASASSAFSSSAYRRAETEEMVQQWRRDAARETRGGGRARSRGARADGQHPRSRPIRIEGFDAGDDDDDDEEDEDQHGCDDADVFADDYEDGEYIVCEEDADAVDALAARVARLRARGHVREREHGSRREREPRHAQFSHLHTGRHSSQGPASTTHTHAAPPVRPRRPNPHSTTRDTHPTHHGTHASHHGTHASHHGTHPPHSSGRHHASGSNPATHPLRGVYPSPQATQATHPIHAHATPSRNPSSPEVSLLRVERREAGSSRPW